jgi:LSD1 subclass zinc finger protein
MTEAIEEWRFPCPNCGGDLTWSPTQKTLVCSSCGTTLPPAPTTTTHPKFLEQDSGQGSRSETRAKPQDRAAFRCSSCRAVSYFDRGSAAARCPFCGAAALAPYDAFADFFRPESIMPFLTSETEARAAASQWIRRAWLAPSKLARLARTGAIKGAYLPFWTFDAHAIAHWDRAGGVRGIIETDFDDVLVCAERDMDARLLAELEPFPSKALCAYDPRYAAGWTVGRAQREQDEAMRISHGQMERELLGAARHSQPAKERDKMQLRGVEYTRETCRQTLLPVWTLDFAYLKRRYRIAVNGATGKAAGSAPTSIAKVAVLTIVALWICLSLADPDLALRMPVLIAKGIRWIVTRPFAG